jgi:ankyrin repeat protein
LQGADVAAKTADREAALHLAALGGYEAMVQLLLEKGADVAVKDAHPGTALHWAARGGHGNGNAAAVRERGGRRRGRR